MFVFDFKGIKVVATTEIKQFDYIDARKGKSTRHERDVNVAVHFWEFTISNGDLYGMAFVQSTLTYFMSSFWKRTPKKGCKIEFDKVLNREHEQDGKKSLHFLAYLKDNKHFLRISVQSGGDTLREVFLDGQEVLLLDIAMRKAINLLTPDLKNRLA